MEVKARTAARVWLVLVAVTCVSFATAEDVLAAGVAATAAILLGLFKARLIFIHFMELKTGVKPYRLLLEAWVVLVALIIVGGYWYSVVIG